jgi:hypothetical protein
MVNDFGEPVSSPGLNKVADKQAYVAELYRADPTMTMNQIGKHVRAKYGSQLSYVKLREAFVGAGGAVDERRGNRTRGASRRGSRKAARRGGRSRENTMLKQAFVAEIVRGNPDITMNEAGKQVRAKFGTQLAFPQLKEAFRGAGGRVGRPGRRAKPRPHVADRRVGRRTTDVGAARTRSTLGSMPRHVVIVHAGGDVVPHEFTSRVDAESFTLNQLQSGTALTSIGYYERQPLKINVGI